MSIHDLDPLPMASVRRMSDQPFTVSNLLKFQALPLVASVVFMTAIPWLHIGYFSSLFLSAPKPTVDRKKCQCGCFDTVFRGTYEYPPSGYKPVYFNAVPETLKLLVLCLFYTCITYEIIRHIVHVTMKACVRKRMVLYVTAYIYPVYYTWWSFFNYINQRFHTYWYHDGYFAVTELISLLFIVQLTDTKHEITATKLLIPLSINLVHILVGGLDQFVVNLFFGSGAREQRARNLGLVIPDLIIVIVCVLELRLLTIGKRLKPADLFYREELIVAAIFVVMSTLLLTTVVSQ